MKLPKGWGLPARFVLVVVLEIGLRNYAARSGLGAALLAPSGQGTDFPLFLALLLLLVRLAAIWIVLPLTVAWVAMALWNRWSGRRHPSDATHPTPV
jgi:cobalamin synthase